MDLSKSTVVVTGGTGFLGRHVADEIGRAGARVRALGRKDYDLRQRHNVQEMLRRLRPDALVHLAASVGGIGANLAEPGRFFYENTVMGVEVLEACRAAGVAKVLVAGTVCAYPKHTPVPFREEDLWAGFPEETNAPYGIAKKALLVQCQAYREQYEMNSIYLLPVNLYGPHDNFDLNSSHVIPAMVRRFSEARRAGLGSVTLWGDGSPTREFLHVRDAARAFRLALERYDEGEPVNVGSGQEISIRRLAGLVADAVGFSGEIVWDSSRPNGQPRRRLATDRAKAAFGFEAEVDLAAGIRQVAEWYERTQAAQPEPYTAGAAPGAGLADLPAR
ncbi:GDP-L-fucose synthase [Frankia sp. CNm7]|uniref:GDP-L-fucose synthase n=1 Tax=Frankia nepalensis TaxID=1836974 RepID=A0A937UQJ2_9ACTN|nr:GDP-L-fucose synthase [Frankia nepalensis]MBL7497291.1 GDP-L-fucose synthase [Frankia nepalensis]MBL7515478.1 GDP-L-fucose synthase [Frankia nepalensis]MBL7522784.1 GDP-L-fucose synthase [Frankia nepalensis]MBL7631904.1 GDP-L-fucose synthase [Frankia nepalensis]